MSAIRSMRRKMLKDWGKAQGLKARKRLRGNHAMGRRK